MHMYLCVCMHACMHVSNKYIHIYIYTSNTCHVLIISILDIDTHRKLIGYMSHTCVKPSIFKLKKTH